MTDACVWNSHFIYNVSDVFDGWSPFVFPIGSELRVLWEKPDSTSRCGGLCEAKVDRIAACGVWEDFCATVREEIG